MNDMRTHHKAIAIIAIIILTSLLGFGLWLFVTGSTFTDQTVLTAPTPDIVPAESPTPTPSPSATVL